ncbi:MAG: hypothetical protein QOJ89_1750 [bacterium]
MGVSDDAAVELWQAVAARGGDELGRLLGQLALTPQHGERQLRRWLADLAAAPDAPQQIATIVSGGSVEKLVTIARADTVNLAVYLGVAPPDAQRGRDGVRVRFNIPPRLEEFTGRDTELGALEQALGVTDEVVISQAITGLGGVGKSQLAARYVRTHEHAYDVIAWIRAEDDATADLSVLAAQLLAEQVDALTPTERADRALHWLSDARERWLLVLDNITDPMQLSRCCPHSGNGRVLITSRNHDLRRHAPLLALDVFDEDTATSYLLEQTGRDDAAGARRLAAALGFLPLALSHAAAYCQAGTTFTAYQGMLTQLPASVLFDSRPDEFYAQTIAATWRPSITAATADASLSAAVLAIAAHVAPDAIPKSLFGVLLDDPADPGQAKHVTDAFNALHRFSLITPQPDTISVHRLVQKTIRDDTAPDTTPPAALQALAALDDAFPSYASVQLPRSWPPCERLIAHVLALPDTYTAPRDSASKMLTLLDRACYYLRLTGNTPRAITTAENNVTHARALLSDEHTTTLTARDELALCYKQAGRTADAIELQERVLTDSERLLGDEHPNTLTARANLAVMRADDP